MSVYFYLGCGKCRVMRPFVGHATDRDWGWLAEAAGPIPEFVSRHVEHLEALHVMSEHDLRVDEYLNEGHPPSPVD